MKHFLTIFVLSFTQLISANGNTPAVKSISDESPRIINVQSPDQFLIKYTDESSLEDFEGIKKINGVDLYCKVMGNGDPLVIVHGGPGLGYEYLVPPFKTLAKDFKLIFYDQRGCGKSTFFQTGEAATIDQFVEDLEGIRKEFKIDKMNLIGQSFGARIALSFTIKYPEHVKKLILLEPAYGSSKYLYEFQKNLMDRLPPSVKGELGRLSQSEALKNYEVDTVKKLVYMRLKYYYFDSAKVNINHLDYFDSVRARNFMMSQAALIKEQMNFDLYDKMKSISVPTLIIRGDYDPIPGESIERMHRAIAKSKLHIVKDCGHFVHIEKPEEYFPVIQRFIKDN